MEALQHPEGPFSHPEGPFLLENTETSSELINDFFYEIILNCEKALNALLQFQEDIFKTGVNLLEKSGTPLPIRQELETLSLRVFPKARTRLDQVLEVTSLRIMLLNRASSQIAGLMARTATLWNSSSLPETWEQVDLLSQRFMKILSADSGIFLNTNTKILQICMELADPQPFLAALSEEGPSIPLISQRSRLRKMLRTLPVDDSPAYSSPRGNTATRAATRLGKGQPGDPKAMRAIKNK